MIEMNPRVSRSSALASKATGFPIAKIAARLAVGYALEEIPNDITRRTPASFEPTIDYAVVKIPRFAFEKFPLAEGGLTTQMKSVGEVMAIGRTFKQAFMKAMRSRELDATPSAPEDDEELLARLEVPSHDRWELLFEALRRGVSVAEVQRRTAIHPWFLDQFAELVAAESDESADGLGAPQGPRLLRRAGRGHAGRAARGGPAAGLQVRGHLRRRVRGRDALFLLRLRTADDRRRGARRGAAPGDDAERRDPRVRAEPHRPGHRVRLLLRACRDDGEGKRAGCGDDQLQPRDRLDRLRHLDAALLRAADRRGRARGGRRGAPGGRDRAVRRPDAAADRGGPAGGGSEAARHAGGRDRPGGGPRPLRRPPGRAGHPGSAVRRGERPRRGDRRGGPDRLPPARPSLLRPGWPGDGDLLRPAGPGALSRAARRRGAGAHLPAAARPLPGERDRAGRGRARRRRGRVRRGDHAARRGGRRALGRLRMRAACRSASARRCSRRSAARRPSWRCGWA